MSLTIRAGAQPDIAAVTEIYAHHVLHAAATFEVEPPDAAEMARRWRNVVEGGYPYLVAEQDGRIAGYAYASAYRSRPAYRYTVENSVYVRAGCERRGIGRALMQALLDQCERGDFRQVIAVIGDSANAASIGLHRQLGFRMVGTLQAAGFKFGRSVDVVLMQRPLGAGAGTLPSR
jgi:L-amino acid N-acyltransferase YncA